MISESPFCHVIAKALSERFHLTIHDLPVLITPAGRRLRQPSLREVAQEAGLLRPLATGNENEILSDLTIVRRKPTDLSRITKKARLPPNGAAGCFVLTL